MFLFKKNCNIINHIYLSFILYSIHYICRLRVKVLITKWLLRRGKNGQCPYLRVYLVFRIHRNLSTRCTWSEVKAETFKLFQTLRFAYLLVAITHASYHLWNNLGDCLSPVSFYWLVNDKDLWRITIYSDSFSRNLFI